MTDEIWKPVVGYESIYEVSDRGGVRSVDRTFESWNGHARCTFSRRGRLMKQCPIGPAGHMSVTLSLNGKSKTTYVHRMVLEAFVGPCPDGCEARHFPDRDVKNNRLANLSWGTHTENMADKVCHGTNGGWKMPEHVVLALRARKVSAEVREKISTGLKRAYSEGRR